MKIIFQGTKSDTTIEQPVETILGYCFLLE